MKKITRMLFGNENKNDVRSRRRIAKQLAAEAEQHKEPAPRGFHNQVMSAVRSEPPPLETSKHSAWPIRLAIGSVAAGVAVFLLVSAGRFGSTDETDTAETPATDVPAEAVAFDYLNSPETVEAFIHIAAMDVFAAEYESLSRDAIAARDFIRSTTGKWFESGQTN